MNPLFSIITASLNCRNDLFKTYLSLKSQTYKNFEWIVIDGHSTDGTQEMLRNIKENCIWLSESDDGISDAWNKGIRISRGSQIIILNSGDTFDSNMLEIFSNNISDKYITCCHVRLIGKNSESIFYARPSLLWRGMHVPHNFCSVPRIKYNELGLYKKIKYSMDFEWFSIYFSKNGADGFRVVDHVLGSFMLGGFSDIHYLNSFKVNELIMIKNGVNKYLAKLIFILYTFKHFMRYKFRFVNSP